VGIGEKRRLGLAMSKCTQLPELVSLAGLSLIPTEMTSVVSDRLSRLFLSV
jgi:hypothetical protein